MMSPRVPAIATGAATSSVSTMTRMSLGMAAATLAALLRPAAGSHGRQGAAHPGRPVGVRMARGDGRAARGAESRAQRRIAVQLAQRGSERGAVAGGDDEPGLLVADEA